MTPHKCPARDGTGLRIRPSWVVWAWDGTWEAHVPPDQL